MPIMYTMA